MALPRSLKLGILASLLLLTAGLAAWFVAARAPQEREEPLGLFTSLPIYWNEGANLSAMLDPDAEPHWARALVEQRRDLRPLDVLAPEVLAPLHDLLVAQPRVLAPAENVALDDWVRDGGRLLLFADPLLTQHSDYALGDQRRPMDVALLSPILARWGLVLTHDERQGEGERPVELLGGPVPVDQAGHFIPTATAPDASSQCRLLAGGLAADCVIGKGRALVVADAALLDGQGPDLDGRKAALTRLMAAVFAHH
ncbi:MAG TPA: ABC transporter [Sphingomonadaceae bacterium]|nr:ABC transporter [Sphingomonadaceae bacterium]